jgi:hypothetical protein
MATLPFPPNAVPEQPGNSSPKIVFEPTEWLEYRVFNAERHDLPRVLLIGDSISGQYFDGVTEAFKGKAYLARVGSSAAVCLPSCLDEIRLALSQQHYAVIHFNNGLHGWDYTEEEYAHGLAALVKFLQTTAPDSKLVWASTTPVREGGPAFQQFEPKNERVKARNKIAAALMARKNIPTDDLYSLMENHPELYSDGTHYNAQGAALLVPQVAQSIAKLLPSK